jgi:hypothetical protein
VIVTHAGQVPFLHGVRAPSREEIDGAYAKLGTTAESAFPIQYTSDVPLAAGPVAGSLKGVCHYRSIRDRTIVTVI